MIFGFVYVVEILPICRIFEYYILWMYLWVDDMVIEVYAIFPLWCFIIEIFMHVMFGEFMEDVTSISWIFIIFAWFIGLIKVGRYMNHLGWRGVEVV